MPLNKLAIGTAQFGVNYGIANTHGQISISEQKAILNFAISSGIEMLDTAIDYGESEKNLGKYGVKNFQIITKIPPIPDNLTNVTEWMRNQVDNSMKRLGVTSIYGLLLHRSNNLLKYDDEVSKYLEDLKKAKVVKKIGISIYSPKELENIIGFFPIDIVQAPLNILDKRIQSTGWLNKLKSINIEVHARSIFLQGLLLMPRSKLPKKFLQWREIWDKWYEWQNDHPNHDSLQICFMFVKSIVEIDRIIVGIDSLNHIKEIINIEKMISPIEHPNIFCNDEKLLYPSNWSDL